MSSKSEFEKLAHEARERRLSGSYYDEDSPFPLTGYCFDNSFVLYNLLTEQGYEPTLIAGLAEEYAESLLREVPIEELDEVIDLAGEVHYWVECNGFVLDIAPMLEESYGEVYVEQTLPDSYHHLSDSESEGQETLESAYSRRCTYCGGQNGYCDCPKNK